MPHRDPYRINGNFGGKCRDYLAKSRDFKIFLILPNNCGLDLKVDALATLFYVLDAWF